MVNSKLMRVPREFEEWIKKRQANLNKELQKYFGGILKKPLTTTDTLRIISRVDGIYIPDRVVKEILKKAVGGDKRKWKKVKQTL